MTTSKNVPAARAAARLLTYMAEQPGPVPAAAIARELELPRSTVYHLLAVLQEENFVTHFPEDRRYGFGVATLALGTAYSRHAPLARLARPVVTRLVEVTGEHGHVAVLNGREVLYLIERRAPRRPTLVTDVDVRLPSHVTASGRAILAALPAAHVRALYPTAGSFTSLQVGGPTSLRELREVLRQVRARGYAEEDGDVSLGMASVAQAVLDHRDYPVAAVAVTFPSESYDETRRAELAELVARAARTIGTRLGGRRPQESRAIELAEAAPSS